MRLNNRGYILFEVIIFVSIIFMIVSSIISLAFMDYKLFLNSKDSFVSYYIAESGLEYAIDLELRGLSVPSEVMIEDEEGKSIGTAKIIRQQSHQVTTLTSTSILKGRFVRKTRATIETIKKKENFEDFLDNVYDYDNHYHRVERHEGSLGQHFRTKSVAVLSTDGYEIDVSWSNHEKPKVLIVLGDLIITRPTTFYGIIYVTGNITILEKSVLSGVIYCQGVIEDNPYMEPNNYSEIHGFIYRGYVLDGIEYYHDLEYGFNIANNTDIFKEPGIKVIINKSEIK